MNDAKMNAWNQSRRIELLAPARDLSCGIAAVNHGADAVYIGAPKFGARAAAGNSLGDIERLINYAHRYRAKVYCTINTILFDEELDEAVLIARRVAEAGIDALIIQDMGLLEAGLPPVPLYASTQMHNYSVAKIRFLEHVGFKRVILARELSLNQIQEIRGATHIDLEFFIHGALCVSFSGRCYLSQATQGRSANRGECAQPCRLRYTLSDAKGKILARNKYLLSLKDLNLSDYLQNLIDGGISSFKIEGRLKDINYVKNVTAFYRRKLDEIFQTHDSLFRTSSGRTIIVFRPDPSKTFNRGFTDYFIRGRNKDILSIHSPKSIGAYLGKVSRVGHDRIELETNESIHNGDGICFFNKKNVLCGTNVNRVEGKTIYPAEKVELSEGTEIYRNYDRTFSGQLEGDTRRRIGVRLVFNEAREGFSLTAADEDGNSAVVVLALPTNPAKNGTKAKEIIARQLTKLGNTIFECTGITIDESIDSFVPVRELNKMRRDVIANLEEQRRNSYVHETVQVRHNTIPFGPQILDFTGNVANLKAESFYRRHGVDAIEPAFELQKKSEGRIVMTTKHCLRFQFDLCKGKRISNAESLFLQDARNRYRLDFDCASCQMKIVLASSV